MSKTLDLPIPIAKESAVRDWARRKLGTLAHETRVAKVAQSLLDLTSPWHHLKPADARLLNLAALVHDVGRSLANKGHAKIGAHLLLENTSLPLSENERRRLAFLTRYHRGNLPQLPNQQYLDPRHDDPLTMQTLLALLRAADNLDSRSLDAPHIIATRQNKTLTIFAYLAAAHPTAINKLAKPKKFQLLESLFNCHIQVRWHITDRLALVS